MNINSYHIQFIKFSFVGALGFVVDTGVLYFLLYQVDMGYFVGRLFSYFVAATFTWYMHRTFTFNVDSNEALHKQWANFLFLNSFGGLANYLTYALLIASSEFFRQWPILAVAIGTPIGVIINFYLSKRVVFKV